MKKYLFLLAFAICGNIMSHAGNIVPPTEEQKQPSLVTSSKDFTRLMPSVTPVKNHNTFFEGFEEWDGTPTWLPEGWKDESKVGHVPATGWYDQDLTWQISGSQGEMLPVYEGAASAYIQVSNYYSTTPYEMQDEWLITPAIDVKETDYLYFYLLYSPAFTCYDRQKNDFSAENTHLEVHISEDGENWTQAWNVMDEIKKMSDEELRENLSSDKAEYTPFYINLEKWSGKKVYIAFRYVGQNGNSMCIDNVAVGLPVPTSYYLAPLSAMYVGLSPEVTSPKTPYMILPPYQQEAWEHVSDSYNGIKWTYEDENGSMQESSDDILMTPAYEPSVVTAPTVQALFNSSASEIYQSDYKEMQIGGGAAGYEDVDGKAFDFYGVSNYNCMDPNVQVKFNKTVGFDEMSVDKWAGLLMLTPYDVDMWGVANFYGKPSAPYVMKDAYLSMYVKAIRPDAKFTMVVRGIDEYGAPSDILAQTTCDAKDIEISDDYTYGYFKFDQPVVVDQAILVEVSGFDYANDQIYIPCLFTNTESNVASAYMALIIQGDLKYIPLSALNGFSNNSHIGGMAMSIGAEYPWMKAAESTTVEAAPENGMLDITLYTNHAPEEIKASSDADWMTIETGEYDAENKIAHFNVTVKENIEEDRTAALTFSTLGVKDDVVYTVSQKMMDVTAIGSVKKEANVAVDGNLLVIDNACCDAMTMYDAAGMEVRSYALNNHTVISMEGMNNGVYILRFSNGKTVKVIR